MFIIRNGTKIYQNRQAPNNESCKEYRKGSYFRMDTSPDTTAELMHNRMAEEETGL